MVPTEVIPATPPSKRARGRPRKNFLDVSPEAPDFGAFSVTPAGADASSGEKPSAPSLEKPFLISPSLSASALSADTIMERPPDLPSPMIHEDSDESPVYRVSIAHSPVKIARSASVKCAPFCMTPSVAESIIEQKTAELEAIAGAKAEFGGKQGKAKTTRKSPSLEPEKASPSPAKSSPKPKRAPKPPPLTDTQLIDMINQNAIHREAVNAQVGAVRREDRARYREAYREWQKYADYCRHVGLEVPPPPDKPSLELSPARIAASLPPAAKKTPGRTNTGTALSSPATSSVCVMEDGEDELTTSAQKVRGVPGRPRNTPTLSPSPVISVSSPPPVCLDSPLFQPFASPSSTALSSVSPSLIGSASSGPRQNAPSTLTLPESVGGRPSPSVTATSAASSNSSVQHRGARGRPRKIRRGRYNKPVSDDGSAIHSSSNSECDKSSASGHHSYTSASGGGKPEFKGAKMAYVRSPSIDITDMGQNLNPIPEEGQQPPTTMMKMMASNSSNAPAVRSASSTESAVERREQEEFKSAMSTLKLRKKALREMLAKVDDGSADYKKGDMPSFTSDVLSSVPEHPPGLFVETSPIVVDSSENSSSDGGVPSASGGPILSMLMAHNQRRSPSQGSSDSTAKQLPTTAGNVTSSIRLKALEGLTEHHTRFVETLHDGMAVAVQNVFDDDLCSALLNGGSYSAPPKGQKRGANAAEPLPKRTRSTRGQWFGLQKAWEHENQKNPNGGLYAQAERARRHVSRHLHSGGEGIAPRGDGRWDFRLGTNFPIDIPLILEPAFRLCSRAAAFDGVTRSAMSLQTQQIMVVEPGAKAQPWHQDHGDQAGYFTILVALNDAPSAKDNNAMGGTELLLPREPAPLFCSVPPHRGQALIFDGRIVHRGLANTSNTTRYFYYAAFSTGHDENTGIQ